MKSQILFKVIATSIIQMVCTQLLNGQSLVFDFNQGPASTVFGDFVVTDEKVYLSSTFAERSVVFRGFPDVYTFDSTDSDPEIVSSDSYRGPYTNGKEAWVINETRQLVEISSPEFPIVMENLHCDNNYASRIGYKYRGIEHRGKFFIDGCNKLLRLDDQGIYSYDSGSIHSYFGNGQIFDDSLRFDLISRCTFSCGYFDLSVLTVTESELDTLLIIDSVHNSHSLLNFYSVLNGRVIHDDFRFENGMCHEWIYRLEENGKKTILREWVTSDPYQQVCLYTPDNIHWLPTEFSDESFYVKALLDSTLGHAGFDFVQITDSGAVDVDSSLVPLEYREEWNLDGPPVISRNTDWVNGFRYRFRNRYIKDPDLLGGYCISSLTKEDEFGRRDVLFIDESEKYRDYCFSLEAPFVHDEEVYFVRKYWGNDPVGGPKDNSEIWKHDGDITTRIASFENTPRHFVPEIFGVFENRLYLSGYEKLTGVELWSLDLEIQNTSDSVELPSSEFSFDLFPNPSIVGNEVSLKTEWPNGDISIYDSVGRVVQKYIDQDLSSVKINTMSWSRGLYLISIRSGDRVGTETIILQ